MNLGVIIVAAGQGLRLGQPLRPFGSAQGRPGSGQAPPKAFVQLRGRPLYQWSLSVFASYPEITEGVLVVPESERKLKVPPFRIVVGGKTRQDSVARGLEILSPKCEGVLVHDAARPLLTVQLIDQLIKELKQGHNAIPLLSISETVKWVEEGKITKTVDRTKLMLAQTPQACLVSDLKRALQEALAHGWQETDEAALLEKVGARVFQVAGDPDNIKVTTPSDLKRAEWLLERI